MHSLAIFNCLNIYLCKVFDTTTQLYLLVTDLLISMIYIQPGFPLGPGTVKLQCYQGTPGILVYSSKLSNEYLMYIFSVLLMCFPPFYFSSLSIPVPKV